VADAAESGLNRWVAGPYVFVAYLRNTVYRTRVGLPPITRSLNFYQCLTQ
jgi:hypothetical protein